MICTNITNCKREGKCGLGAVNIYYKCKIFMPFIFFEKCDNDTMRCKNNLFTKAVD